MTVSEEKHPLCGKRAAEFLARNTECSVPGFYSGAMYLEAEGKLLLIAPASRGVVPFGIGITDYPALHDALGTAPERAVITSVRGTGDILINFPGAELRLSGVIPCEETFRPERLPERGRIAECAALITERHPAGLCLLSAPLCGKPELLESAAAKQPYLAAARGRVRDVFAALRRNAGKEACGENRGENRGEAGGDALAQAISRLVGLGPGLTPSGDDFLSGMLYFLHCFSALHPGIADAAKRLSAAVRASLSLTNTVSREYLLSAAAGEYFGVTAGFSDVLQRLPGESTEPELPALLSVGSSSGSDIAAGMLCAADSVISDM